MARGKNRLTFATRLIVGAVIFIIVMFAVTNFGNLTISPFQSSTNFRDIDKIFNQFSLAEVTALQNYVKGTPAEIAGKTCYLKLYTSVQLTNARIVPLNSEFQTFGGLETFTLTSPEGTDITGFKNIEVRMRCDLVESKDGSKRLPFEVSPRASNPLSMYIYAYNEVGKFVLLKGGSYKPIDILGIPIPYTESAVNINPTSKIVYSDSGLTDPNNPTGTALYITSERTISKPFQIYARDLESAIDATNPLATKSTFGSEVTFSVSGAFDLTYPDLAGKVQGFPHQIPVDQGLLVNKFDIVVNKGVPKTVITVPALTDITKVDPTILTTDGSVDISAFVTAYVTLYNFNAVTEGKPTGEIFLQKLPFGLPTLIQSSTPTARSNCSPAGTSGFDAFFKCDFAIKQNVEPATYRITIKNNNLFRSEKSASFDVIRANAPVGVKDIFGYLCKEGQTRNSLGLCEYYQSTSPLPIIGACPTGQERNSLGVCIVPTGGTGGLINQTGKCPLPNYERDSLGTCVPVVSTIIAGKTKPCFDCNQNQIRIVNIEDICPEFQCNDGSKTGGVIPFCTDKKPASKTATGYTCTRGGGTTTGGLGLPKIIPCDAGEIADATKNEVCVPTWLYGLFQNYNFVWLGLGFIVLIIIIAIIAGALKGRGNSGGGYL